LTADVTALLAPGRCAVVVVDLQNDYCHPDGALPSTRSRAASFPCC
jgi:nicotinamidase-related amidase